MIFQDLFFHLRRLQKLISSILNPATFEGLGTAPPLRLHWRVIFKIMSNEGRWHFVTLCAKESLHKRVECLLSNPL